MESAARRAAHAGGGDAAASGPVLEWLMQSDPAIRWQVMRDLLDARESRWRAEQMRVAHQGWGARLLAHQDAAGRWTPRLYGKKWISTTYSMVLLRQFGLPPGDARAERACRLFLDQGLAADGGIDPSTSLHRSETCVTGMVLGVLAWFGCDHARRERLVDYLLREQMADGGWNCQRHNGAVHSSFHTTINVLEGLREVLEAGTPRAAQLQQAMARAREFFLVHRLYRLHRTGAVVNGAFTRFSFPPRWHHDVLRTLDHFQASVAPYDERLDDAIALVLKRRTAAGRWLLQNRHPGATFFELETMGQPSRWNTLRALRVLRWRDRMRGSSTAPPPRPDP